MVVGGEIEVHESAAEAEAAAKSSAGFRLLIASEERRANFISTRASSGAASFNWKLVEVNSRGGLFSGGVLSDYRNMRKVRGCAKSLQSFYRAGFTWSE